MQLILWSLDLPYCCCWLCSYCCCFDLWHETELECAIGGGVAFRLVRTFCWYCVAVVIAFGDSDRAGDVRADEMVGEGGRRSWNKSLNIRPAHKYAEIPLPP